MPNHWAISSSAYVKYIDSIEESSNAMYSFFQNDDYDDSFNISEQDLRNFLTFVDSDCCIIFRTNNYKTADDIVKIAEDMGKHARSLFPDVIDSRDKCIQFISDLAKKDGIKLDNIDSTLKEGIYTYLDLNNLYEEYKTDYIYKLLASKENKDFKSNKKDYDPMRKLNDMVGLSNIKTLSKEILNFYKMKTILKNRKITKDNICKHMVFYGSPGTAKTTVARLLSQIFKDNCILPSNKFVEVSRNDLISEYVGQTSIKTHSAIMKAKGGVLFIDEAYSIIDKWYGKECLATLVRDMENLKDDTIIIFAGYKEPMSKFLDANDGLRSRIAFHVTFEDYNKEELVQIFKLMCKERKYGYTDGAITEVETVINKHIKEKNFGNGRFVRNVLEQSILKQANRIVSTTKDVYKVTNEELVELKKEDIVDINTNLDENNHRIGFSGAL